MPCYEKNCGCLPCTCFERYAAFLHSRSICKPQWRQLKREATVQRFLQTWNNLFHWGDFLIRSPEKFLQSTEVRTVSKSSPCFSAFGTQFKSQPGKCFHPQECPQCWEEHRLWRQKNLDWNPNFTIQNQDQPPLPSLKDKWIKNKHPLPQSVTVIIKIPSTQEKFNDKHKHHSKKKKKRHKEKRRKNR